MSPILLPMIYRPIRSEMNYCVEDFVSVCRHWHDEHLPADVLEASTTRFERLYQYPNNCACHRNRPSNGKDDNPEQGVDWVGCHDYYYGI